MAYLAVVGNRDRGLAWPYLLRRVADVPELAGSEATDVHSVYGYPGPIAWGCAPADDFVSAAWLDILAIWREQGAVSAFTRFHPLLNNAALIAGLPWASDIDEAPGHVVDGGPTVSVDLSLADADTRRAYGRDLRREIDHARSQGLTTMHDEDWADLPAFADLYRATMSRSQASEYYFFDEGDFRRLRDHLSGHLHLLVTRSGDTVAAAGLFTEWEGIVEWYLVGSSDAFRALAPTKVLLDDAIRWARARGARVMHLGGGRGGHGDSLYWFKSRFSPMRHRFSTGRWILDRDLYRAQVEAHRVAGPEGSELEAGFFPGYRAPAIHSTAASSGSKPTPLGFGTRPVEPTDGSALASLLQDIDTTYFKPHPMTAEEAQRIAGLDGRDIYLIGFIGADAVAYGMLRGWQEGFAVPSLGIGIRRSRERQGLGRAMMLALHEAAREHGAASVRLRVHPENVGAAALYRSLGYREVGIERGEILMVLDLP